MSHLVAGFRLVVASASAPKEAKVVGGENALQVPSRSTRRVGRCISRWPGDVVCLLAGTLGPDDEILFWMDVAEFGAKIPLQLPPAF